MIKHIVLLKWKDGTDAEAVSAISHGFAQLAQSVNEISSYHFGTDAGIYPNEYDYGLVAEFATEADFKRYAANADHQQLMKDLISPVMESYTALQFHID